MSKYLLDMWYFDPAAAPILIFPLSLLRPAVRLQ